MTTVTIEKKSEFKAQLQIIKEAQKERADNIRKLRSTRKQSPYGFVPGLESASWEYRHYHVAYSELRGRLREQIEAKCDNPPDEYWIQKIKDNFLATLED